MNLPADIIYEIFSWLPAKSICKFRCCSKSISMFTKETNFALKQSQNSMLKDDSCIFIQGDELLEIHALRGEKASSGIPINFLRFLNERSARILASSNGLLLCQIFQRDSTPQMQLFICNPTTQSRFSVATPHCLLEDSRSYVTFAFEWNRNTGVDCEEYNLFLFEGNFYPESLGFTCKIYMPKEGVWKERERSFFVGDVSDRFLEFDFPVLHKGAIHFALGGYYKETNSFYVVAYTLESGISRILEFPEEAIETPRQYQYLYSMHVFQWGKVGSSNESICLVRLVKGFVFTIWVLTHYESSSWSKLLTLSLKEMGLGKKNSIVDKFMVMNGDSLVFSTITNVFRYDLIGKRKRRLEKICKHGFDWGLMSFTSYSNTLRSCGTGATASPFAERSKGNPPV